METGRKHMEPMENTLVRAHHSVLQGVHAQAAFLGRRHNLCLSFGRLDREEEETLSVGLITSDPFYQLQINHILSSKRSLQETVND